MNDPVDLSLRQFQGAWELMCSPCPAFLRESGGGLEFIFSGLPIAFFNIVLVADRKLSGGDLSERGRAACERAQGLGVPWLLVVTHEGLGAGVDAASALAQVELVPLLPLTGMAAQQLAPMARLPEGLEIVRPEDDAGCSAVLKVNSKAYGMDLAAAEPALGTAAFWREHFPVLGRADGKPASSAAVMWVDGHRYVALVATDPAQQRRGFAEAAMRRALDLSARAHGECPTYLHATDAGRPIYARMGYTALTSHTLFIERRFVQDH